MTDLPPPPEDPQHRLQWARQLVAKWSRPEYRGLLSREEILKGARQTIREHERQSPQYQSRQRARKFLQQLSQPQKPLPGL